MHFEVGMFLLEVCIHRTRGSAVTHCCIAIQHNSTLKGPRNRRKQIRDSERDRKRLKLSACLCFDKVSFYAGMSAFASIYTDAVCAVWVCICAQRHTFFRHHMLPVSAPNVCFEHGVFMGECNSAQPKVKLTDSVSLRSRLVFLIDRHNAKVQAPSLAPMLIQHSCIFMSSLGINQLNKGWGHWRAAFLMTMID